MAGSMRRAKAAVAYLSSQGIGTARLEAVVSFGKTQPVIATPGPEERNRRTVTEVRGFVRGHPSLLNGKYAEVIFREMPPPRGELGTTACDRQRRHGAGLARRIQ